MGRRAAELTGARFEHFEVANFHGHDRRGIRHWLCLCKCGVEFTERANRLTNGSRESCGCVKKESFISRATKHGMTGTPEFKAWEGAKRRCRNPDDKSYRNYGGRGIAFSEAWERFEDFYRDMGDRPGPGYSIDRIDVNGDYEPGNCRWATDRQQANNRRNNVKVPVNGKEVSLFVYYGRQHSPAWQRTRYRMLNGWSLGDAIFQPVYAPKPHANGIAPL